MTTNEGRCEPGPGAKPMTHHWVGPDDGDVEPWLWDGAWMRGHQYYTAEQMRARGWVYSAPCVEPATVAALEAERDDWKRLCTIAEPEVAALRQEVQRAGKACFDAQQETVFYRAEVARMKKAASTINEEVCQTLGAALGYPWFKDDQTNFPGATETDGVCVGPHVAESLAAEAAAKLATVAALVEALEGMAGAADHENWHLDCVLAKALSDARAALAAYREAGR